MAAMFGVIWLILFVALAFVFAAMKMKINIYELVLKFLGSLLVGAFLTNWFDQNSGTDFGIKVFFLAIGLTAMLVTIQPHDVHHTAKA